MLRSESDCTDSPSDPGDLCDSEVERCGPLNYISVSVTLQHSIGSIKIFYQTAVNLSPFSLYFMVSTVMNPTATT